MRGKVESETEDGDAPAGTQTEGAGETRPHAFTIKNAYTYWKEARKYACVQWLWDKEWVLL